VHSRRIVRVGGVNITWREPRRKEKEGCPLSCDTVNKGGGRGGGCLLSTKNTRGEEQRLES